MEGKRFWGVVIGLIVFLLALLAFVFAYTAGAQHIYAPGDTHTVHASWQDTLGTWYKASMDSVPIWIYAPPGSLWKHDQMTMVRPGVWIYRTPVDSAGVEGNYWAEMPAYDVNGRNPLAIDNWLVTENFAPFGARTVTIACIDTSLTPDAGVASTNVTVRNTDSTRVVAYGSTDSEGEFSFTYPAGVDTLVLMAEKLGTVYFGADTLALPSGDSDQADSLLGYTFDPGAPAVGDCVVFGYLYEDGTAVENVLVTRRIILPSSAYSYVVVTATGLILPWGEVDTTTDSAGYFEFDLWRNSSLTPASTTYEITIYWHDHLGRERKIPIGFTLSATTSCPVDLGEINL